MIFGDPYSYRAAHMEPEMKALLELFQNIEY